MNRDDGVLSIVLATEHLLDLAGLHFQVERLERLRELGVDGLAGIRPFDEHGEIVALLLERPHQIAILFEAAALLHDALRLGLVLPEIGCGGAGFEAGQLFVGACGLKDNSEDLWRAGSGLRNGASTPRRWAWLILHGGVRAPAAR